MTANLQVVNNENQLQPEDSAWGQQRIDLLKRTICKDADDDELTLFIQVCKRTGLDPFARQIYAVKRNDSKSQKKVMSIQTSIDGFRLIAERTGKYAGQKGPEWCDEDGVWHDVWLGEGPPKASRVGVLRSDFKEPIYSVARFDSYSQESFIWKKMPDLMLAKCAESLALRRAFPQELSGLYTVDEMSQAYSEDSEEPRIKVERKPSSRPSILQDKTEEKRGPYWTYTTDKGEKYLCVKASQIFDEEFLIKLGMRQSKKNPDIYTAKHSIELEEKLALHLQDCESTPPVFDVYQGEVVNA